MASVLSKELLASQSITATTTSAAKQTLVKDSNFIGHILVTNATSDVAEITELDLTGIVAADLDGKYFTLYDEVGSVGFWIDVDNSGTTEPAGSAALDRSIEITTITTGMTAAQQGTAIYNAIVADSKFVAGSAASTPVITVESSTVGFRTAGVDGDTGIAISRDTEGTDVASYAAKIQHSHDGSNWIDLLDFTAVSADVNEVVHVDNTTVHVMEYVRAVLTKTTGRITVVVDLLHDRIS